MGKERKGRKRREEKGGQTDERGKVIRERANSLPLMELFKRGEKRKERQKEREIEEIEVFRKSSKVERSPIKGLKERV